MLFDDDDQTLDVEKMLDSCWSGLIHLPTPMPARIHKWKTHNREASAQGCRRPPASHAKEEGELEEGEIKDTEIEDGEFVEYGVGDSVNESINTPFLGGASVEEDHLVDPLLDHEMEFKGMVGLEEELHSFPALGALVNTGSVKQPRNSLLAQTLDVAQISVPADSLKALPSEIKESLDLSAHAQVPLPVVLSTSNALNTGNLIDPTETLEPRASDLPKLWDKPKLLNSTRNTNEPDSMDFIRSMSKHEEKVVHASVLPMLVESEDPKALQPTFPFGQVQRSMQKIYPRRSKSAVRTFPPGCGKNAQLLTIEKQHNPVEYAEARRLGDVKTSMQNRLGQTEKSRASGLKPTLFSGKADKEIKSSGKELHFKSVTTSNAMNVKSKFPGKSMNKSDSKVEKYVLAKRSLERVNVGAQMVASNRSWNQEKQLCRSPLGFTTNTQKRKQNMQMQMRVKKKREYEGSSGDGPLVERSRHRGLSSKMSGLHDLADKVDIQSGDARNKVRKALRLFQSVFRILTRDEEVTACRRIDLKAASILRQNKIYVNTGEQILGVVPGVEVGDEFHYRVELSIIGLHRPYQGGIDYVKRDGQILATSIVASGAYDDDMDNSDVLVYSGQGGNPTVGAKVATDQKLERGNLALKNSMDRGTGVRVIRGSKEAKGSATQSERINMAPTFTYDGLYRVEKYWTQKGSYGNKVFMFQLRRMEGQPELPIKELKKSKKGSGREGICVKDISGGKERIPIAAVNTIDSEQPPQFEYITKMIHPKCYNPIPRSGCGCKDKCSSSMNCSCAIKNGGRIPFDRNSGAIVEAKPIIYECGPHCSCPSECYNRVSQRGIMFQLEVFKTKSRGWGVRSLTSIKSGSFICEYTGEFLEDSDAEKRTGNDEYLFDIGRGYNDHTLWDGLSSLIPPDLKSTCSYDSAEEDVGFTIDAARRGNVGRFINHSCSPNLYAQNVLYDHDDKRMPHIMLFAAENIPPLKELTYHYNMGVDQVRDCNGNIKKKKCYCGSPECTGRMY